MTALAQVYRSHVVEIAKARSPGIYLHRLNYGSVTERQVFGHEFRCAVASYDSLVRLNFTTERQARVQSTWNRLAESDSRIHV